VKNGDKKQLATKPKTLPAVIDFEQYAGAGQEGMQQQDYAIPFLAILQTGSPQLNRSDGSFIKGALAGQILQTVSSKCYDELEVIPCAFSHRLVEWRPRGSGGGLVMQYERELQPTDTHVNDKGQLERPNGNLLIPTAYHYVLILDGPPEPGVIAMTSTQLKKSKKWNSLMASLKMQGKNGMYTPPTFAYRYKLSTVGESNDKGSWFGWNIEATEAMDSQELLKMAVDLVKNARSISTGAMRTQDQPDI